MTAEFARESANPFSAYDLWSLIDGAARLQPHSVCLIEDGETWTAARVAQAATAVAGSLQELGLGRRDRIVLAGAANARGIVTLFGAGKAGLDIALASLDLDGRALSAYARAVGARAIIGPSRFAEMDVAASLFEAAAAAETVRVVATFGPEAADGAVDLDPVALTRADILPPSAAAMTLPGLIVPARNKSEAIRIDQSALVAAAFDFAATVGACSDAPILSLMQPSSFAGLAVGPVASLLCGAPLRLCAPWRKDSLMALAETSEQVHLVGPVLLGPMLADAFGPSLASLTLVSRRHGLAGGTPAAVRAPCPVFDLYAIGETAALTERRSAEGVARPPAQEPHYATFDGARRIMTAKRGPNGALEGAAVNPGVAP